MFVRDHCFVQYRSVFSTYSFRGLQSGAGYLGLALVFGRNSARKSFFGAFLLVLTKFLFWRGGGWTLGYHSMEFRHLTDISYFPRILSLKSFGNSFVYTMFISNNRPSFHLRWKENLVKDRKVSKYYETDRSFSFSLFCFAFCLSCFQVDVLFIDLQVLSSLSFRSHFILR